MQADLSRIPISGPERPVVCGMIIFLVDMRPEAFYYGEVSEQSPYKKNMHHPVRNPSRGSEGPYADQH
jgi:hypothetical protein